MNFFIMPTINFFLRSNNDKAKTFVLYCRVSYNNTKIEFSTTEKLIREEFDPKTQRCLSKNKPQRIFIDSLIDSIRYKAKMAMLQDIQINTAREIVELVLFPKPKEQYYIDELILKYIDSAKNEVRATTIQNHQVKLRNLEAFQKIKKQHFTIDSFTYKVADEYHNWIKQTAKTIKNTNATRNIVFIKMCIFKLMPKSDYTSFAIQNYTGPKDSVNKPVFLNATDRGKLISFEPQSLYLRNVRDLFLFQCFTGLSYSDLQLFKVIESNGVLFIAGNRFKNEKPYQLPLLPEAKNILIKHSGNIPTMQNEPYNRGLKEVCAILDIDVRLSSHVGRKTFATMMNDRGVSRESVAIMLGHSSLRTSEQHYIGFSPGRLFLELEKIG